MSRPNLRLNDKLKGMLIGLAVGDMLGAPLEFATVGEFEPITEPIEGGTHNLPKGYWTDDTSMALCIADSLLEHGGYNSYDIMNRYWLWRSRGYRSSTGKCFDIGNQVSEAINTYMMTGGFVKSDRPRTNNAGNGAIMRLAPVIIAAHVRRKPSEIIQMARLSATETHYSFEAEVATEVFGTLLLRALNSRDKSKIIRLRKIYPWHRFVMSNDDIVINGQQPTEYTFQNVYDRIIQAQHWDKSQLQNTGYIIHSLQIAVWAFKNYDNFKDGALAVVNLGGDADTNGAIYGQLAGAFYGHSNIPYKWRKVLYKESTISSLADKLISMHSCPILLSRFEIHTVS